MRGTACRVLHQRCQYPIYPPYDPYPPTKDNAPRMTPGDHRAATEPRGEPSSTLVASREPRRLPPPSLAHHLRNAAMAPACSPTACMCGPIGRLVHHRTPRISDFLTRVRHRFAGGHQEGKSSSCCRRARFSKKIMKKKKKTRPPPRGRSGRTPVRLRSRNKSVDHGFLNPSNTAVPFCGQTTLIPSRLPPERDCSTKWVITSSRKSEHHDLNTVDLVFLIFVVLQTAPIFPDTTNGCQAPTSTACTAIRGILRADYNLSKILYWHTILVLYCDEHALLLYSHIYSMHQVHDR